MDETDNAILEIVRAWNQRDTHRARALFLKAIGDAQHEISEKLMAFKSKCEKCRFREKKT